MPPRTGAAALFSSVVSLFELVLRCENADQSAGPHAVQDDVPGPAKRNDQLTERRVVLLPCWSAYEREALEHLDRVSNGHLWTAARVLPNQKLGELGEVFEGRAREAYFVSSQSFALRFALLEA